MASLPIVRDSMDTVVPTVSPELPIVEAVDFLLANRVTGAPVVDGEGRVVGIITEKDCLRILTEGEQGNRAAGTVRDYMTREVTSVESGMNLYFVAGLFLQANFRRLPVVDQGRLVGAITRFDVLRVISANYKRAAR